MIPKIASRPQLPSWNHFRTRMLPRYEPVVFRNAVKDWPLTAKGWDGPQAILARLRAILADRVVPVSALPPKAKGRLSYDHAKQTPLWDRLRMPFGRFASELERELRRPTGAVLCVQAASIPLDLPELSRHIRLPLVDKRLLERGSPRLWIGNGGQAVGLHFDETQNFNCLLAGRKRFTLFPPEELPNLYVGPFLSQDLKRSLPTSLIDDPGKASLRRFPLLRKALRKARVVELEPGDMLFLPAYWWHHVESFGFNVAVNFWWNDVSMSRHSASRAAFFHALLALRDLPPYRRKLWRAFFDHYVFGVNGDPYPHLKRSRQGPSGAPTPARLALLRQGVIDGLTGQA